MNKNQLPKLNLEFDFVRYRFGKNTKCFLMIYNSKHGLTKKKSMCNNYYYLNFVLRL